MTDRLTDEQRIRADYIKWELAARELGHAIHRRHALDDGPLIVRTPDDVTKNDRDRWATPEEVSEWKAAADAEVAKLTAKRDAIEKARLDEANSLERELAGPWRLWRPTSWIARMARCAFSVEAPGRRT